MRIAVVGAGSIGGFIAAALFRSGIEVGVIARGDHLAAIRRYGLRVESDLGNFSVAVEASDRLSDLGQFDVLLLTFKAHQWGPLLPQLLPYSQAGATIVTLQNGLPFWYVREPPVHSVDPGGRIAAALSGASLVGGVVHVSGNLPEPGVVRQSGGVRYLLGAVNPAADFIIDPLLAAMCDAGLDAKRDPDMRGSVWLKLVNNVGLNAVSALRGMTIRPLLQDPAARMEVAALMREALQVGQALGVVQSVDIEARIAYASRLDDVKTSMLQDVQRRRSLELEPIFGAVIELAQRCAVDVPHIRACFHALRHWQKTSVPRDA